MSSLKGDGQQGSKNVHNSVSDVHELARIRGRSEGSALTSLCGSLAGGNGGTGNTTRTGERIGHDALLDWG